MTLPRLLRLDGAWERARDLLLEWTRDVRLALESRPTTGYAEILVRASELPARVKADVRPIAVLVADVQPTTTAPPSLRWSWGGGFVQVDELDGLTVSGQHRVRLVMLFDGGARG